MLWALVCRNGIAGLIPPPTHYREDIIRDRAARWKSKNKRTRGNPLTGRKGIVDLLLDDLFVHRFMPIDDHIHRLSKWCCFWESTEPFAREFGYAVFSNLWRGRDRHYNPLPL